MSEEQKLDTASTPETNVSDDLLKPVEFGGKFFELSTEGRKQLTEYGNTVTSLIGKLGNEVGKLRKFEPTASEEELLTKVSQLRDEGSHVDADRLIVGFTKLKENEILQRVSIESQNELTWKEYFKSRPELTELFDEDVIKNVSESKLNVYASDNVFKSLDEYWLPKVARLNQSVSAKKPEKIEKPPVTLSGGAGRQSAPAKSVPETPAKPESFAEMLKSRSIYNVTRK